MKHKKLSISIVTAFIAALGLTACSNATKDDNAIVTLTGFGDNPIEINTDAIYNKFKESEDGLTSFYQAILEVMIRDYFEQPDLKTVLEGFEKSAKNDVESDKEKARNNKEANKTSYDEEWKAILDAAGVEDENGLYQKHLYDYEKEEYTDLYFKQNKGALTSEYIGFQDKGVTGEPAFDGKTSVYPYHIRHILVKTTASAKDYVTGEITATEAQRLNTVYEALVSGVNTFGNVAKQWSEDGSADNYGDAGIMTTATSFVNEFKLGIYAYDMVYGTNVTGDLDAKSGEAVNEKLGFQGSYNESATTVKDKLEGFDLGEVSYEVFEFLGDEYKTETDENGLKVNDGLAKYFPRNIMWNNYLNDHNVFVITDSKLEGGLHQDKYAQPVGLTQEAGKTGFRKVPNLNLANPDTKVLTDELGRVIVGVRSEFGIHFMVMERTPFELEGTIVAPTATGYKYDTTSINEYYTTLTPDQHDFPADNDVKKTTYVNHINAQDGSVYASRAETVKNEIKGFDKLYDYRMFEALKANGNIKINDPIVEKNLEDYMAKKVSYNAWNTSKELNNSWNTYLDLLSRQEEVKGAGRMVKPTCAIGFKANDTDGLFGKGGECYYEK